MAVLLHRRCTRSCGITSRSWLRQSETTKNFSGCERRNETRFLIFCPEVHYWGRSESRVRRNRYTVRRIHFCHLVDCDHVAQRVEPGAPERLRPRYSKQTELAHLLDVLPWEFLCRIEFGGDWCDFLARKLAHHVTNRDMLVAEVKRIVH